MYDKKQYGKPFCGLSLRLYETQKKAPSFEYQASASKSKLMCSLTKKLYSISQVVEWYNTPQVQEYAKEGYELKCASKIQQAKESKYGADTEQTFCFYMAKPYKPKTIDGMKPIGQSIPRYTEQPMTQAQPSAPDNSQIAGLSDLDDEIPF